MKMSKFVDIHFRAEGDDDRIASLHEQLGSELERGWTNPFRKGFPMSNGEPSPTNYTSIIIAEGVQDTADSRLANPSIHQWLTANEKILQDITFNSKIIQVCIYLEPDKAYEGFFFDINTIAKAAEMQCGLEVMSYRLIKDAEA